MDATINNIYPWGRTFDEYRRMFSVADADLKIRILGCADGPAAFNATMHTMGRRVISVDPLYHFSADEIRLRINATAPLLLAHAAERREQFVWDDINSVDALGQRRMHAMNEFLADYELGRCERRYLAGSLPSIDLPDASFDLALCSHYLFLYSAAVSYDAHVAGVRELCRLAREVRIFPLFDMDAKRSVHCDLLADEFQRSGYSVSVERVPYEFLRGANEMMRVRRSTSSFIEPL